jgi:hypothetical protein
MSNGTPLLEITNAGLAVASVANPQGPFIHITSFEVGSAFGYTPQSTDSGLNGNLLFSGVPTSYEFIGNNTLNIICQIPVDAGPFQFGEVALFLEGGVMFAKGVFDEPQTKFSSLGTNVVSSYTFNCLLKLQQSVAVFQIDTINAPPTVLDIFQWSDVFPPGVSANPDVPLYVVRELAFGGDSTLLQNTSDAAWTVGTTYHKRVQNGNDNGVFPVANSSTSWVEISAALLHPQDLTATNRRFLVNTADGFFRSVSTVVTSGANYRFNLNVSNDGTYNNTPLLNAPPIGSNIQLFDVEVVSGTIYYSQIVDPPPPPALATVGNPGLAYGGPGLFMPGPGVIEAFGMLQSPSTGAGRVLTSADDLNNAALSSGLYCMFGASTGRPANVPVSALDFMVWIHNIGLGTGSNNGSDITQIAFPMNGGGGDPAGNNGQPPFWRQGYNNNPGGGTANVWTTWEPLLVSNKQGGAFWSFTDAPPFGSSAVNLLTFRGVGTYLFVGAIDGFPNPPTPGNTYTLPGQPGTWMAMSVGATGANGRDWLYLRVV